MLGNPNQKDTIKVIGLLGGIEMNKRNVLMY